MLFSLAGTFSDVRVKLAGNRAGSGHRNTILHRIRQFLSVSHVVCWVIALKTLTAQKQGRGQEVFPISEGDSYEVKLPA